LLRWPVFGHLEGILDQASARAACSRSSPDAVQSIHAEINEGCQRDLVPVVLPPAATWKDVTALRSAYTRCAGFAGVWTNWTSVRKVKEGKTVNDLYAFLTTDPNAEVCAIHPKRCR
jgi:hypothetical protein